MSPVRGGFAGDFALAAAAAGTTWLALLSWRGFTEQPVRFLGPLLVLGAVIAGTGAVARWARLSAPLVVLCQVVVSGALASTMLSGSPIPVGPAWERLRDSFADALTSAERYAAPLPSHVPPVDPILIAGGFACLLLVDVLACTLRRAPLAGLPLLTIYSVPVSILLSGVSWWIFAATAGGFLLMLFLQESEQVARWGRPLGDEAASAVLRPARVRPRGRPPRSARRTPPRLRRRTPPTAPGPRSRPGSSRRSPPRPCSARRSRATSAGS